MMGKFLRWFKERFKMYLHLKNLLKAVVPISIIRKFSTELRSINRILYYGNNHQCSICKANLRKFIMDKTGNLCPVCGSLDRTRHLYNYIKKNNLLKGKVLHFSPPKCLKDRFENLSNVDYFPTDYLGEFQAKYQYNIEQLPVDSGTFNLIICYHILEHIVNDRMAMKELFRVLDRNGILMIQTPFKEGAIYEDFSISSEKERLHAFGQEDHVRIYSVDGLVKRFQEVNPSAAVDVISNEHSVYEGLSDDTIIVIRREY